MKYFLLAFILLPFISRAQILRLQLIADSASSLPSAIFNFSLTASSVTGATNFYGDPTASPSFTDATTGWTLQAIGANWLKYGGAYYGGVNNGSTLASSDGTFTQAQIASNLYSINSWSTTSPNYCLKFTNLPAGTYQIIVLGSIQSGVFNNSGAMEFHVQFGTGSDNYATVDPNGGSGVTTGNLQTNGPGTTNVLSGSFTGTITSGQTINLMLSKGTTLTGTSGQLGYINALKITKTN